MPRAARTGTKFEDHTQAVRNLGALPHLRAEVVAELARLPGFRNVLIHEYVALDLARLDAVAEFVAVVAAMEGDPGHPAG